MNHKFIRRTGLFSLTGVLFMMLFIQCSEDNNIEPLEGNPTSGSDMINTNSSEWRFDKAHSNVRWETMYYGDNALLNGRFNNFSVDIDFDEANPENSRIDAWVQLSTFNTGEPGRDSPGKCGPGYMGIDYLDTNYTVDPNTDTAWFSSKSVASYGDGYVATGDLTFRGVTNEEKLYFRYLGINDESDPTEPPGTSLKAGFKGHFTINARTIYGVPSTSIADEVTVLINANVRND